MDYNKINKCIRKTIKRLQPEKYKMNAYSYVDYFCNRNNLEAEVNMYIRKIINKYIKRNEDKLFPCEFTINGI